MKYKTIQNKATLTVNAVSVRQAQVRLYKVYGVWVDLSEIDVVLTDSRSLYFARLHEKEIYCKED